MKPLKCTALFAPIAMCSILLYADTMQETCDGLAERWRSVEEGRLVIYGVDYDKEVVRFARHVDIKLNYYFGPSSSDEPIRVFLFASAGPWRKFVHRIGGREDALALSRDHDVAVQSDGESIHNALAHELAHVRMREQFDVGLPLWLEEGLARYLEWVIARDFLSLDGTRITRELSALPEAAFLGIEEDFEQRQYPVHHDDARAYYRVAEAMVRQIVQLIGPDELAAYLSLLADEDYSWRSALLEHYGIEPSVVAGLLPGAISMAQTGGGW